MCLPLVGLVTNLIHAGLAPLGNGLERLTRRCQQSFHVLYKYRKVSSICSSLSFCVCFSSSYELLPIPLVLRKEKGYGGRKPLEQAEKVKKTENKEGHRKEWSAVSWHTVHRKQLSLARSGGTVWWLDPASAPCTPAPWAVSATGGPGHRCPGDRNTGKTLLFVNSAGQNA